ncbi:MAG: hypothetical protein OWT28_04650 [Firmicutes bacterium]|nr:hypothetical protein [Bacillota bacterium]
MRKSRLFATIALTGVAIAASSAVGLNTHAQAAPIVSQQQVWKTMFEATHNYTTVQGTMTYDLPPNDLTISFGVQEGSNPQGYEQVTDIQSGAVTRTVSTEHRLLNIDVTRGLAQEMTINQTASPSPSLPANLSFPNNLSIPDPAMAGIEHTLTDPYELLHALLDNFSSWSVSGTSTVFGRTAYKIAGTLDPSYGARFNADQFTMVVDAKTGVIFSVTFLNSSGQSTGSISMDSVTFNQPLKQSKLSLAIPNGVKLVAQP